MTLHLESIYLRPETRFCAYMPFTTAQRSSLIIEIDITMDTDQESTRLKPEAAETGLMSSQKTISACAEACNIDPKLIECIYPAHPEQEHHNGTYLEQMVLQFDHMASVQQQKFLIKVIDTIRIKNYILRTRLVNTKTQSTR